MQLIFDGERLPEEKFLSLMEEAAEYALEHEGVTNEDLEISVTFVDEEEIKEINGQFREIDKVTDVLSFPQFECADDVPEEGLVILGDVVICEDQAKRQAEEFGHSYERELMYLFVHSMFHLLGYDHMEEEEKAQMRSCEEDVMHRLGIERI
ncbi:MAG: rRNA maturation RNase YbeY [Eubacterium sp.]|nr:rRNA maturation RNase YbeY [Eubacterium sp.]